MEIFYGIMKIIIGLITGNEIWKANDERNLGFTILWMVAGLFLAIVFGING